MSPTQFLTRTIPHLGAVSPLLLVLMLAACGSDSNSPIAPEEGAVASVTVSPAELTLQSGATADLTATVKDAAGNVLTDLMVTWSSSNTNCVTVDETGTLSAKGPPGAVIWATVEGKRGTATISVFGSHLSR